MENIERALRDGCRLHAFRSGGGLRVVRMERDGTLVGYGEHPEMEEALRHADEDVAAGGRPYAEVYGEDGLYDHYLTGSSTKSSDLDAWILKGGTFDAYVAAVDEFVAELEAYENTPMPEGVEERTRNGEVIEWEHRGYRYQSGPCRFPNGERGCSTSVVFSPPGRGNSDPWMYKVVREGRGASLKEAIDAALKADGEEPIVRQVMES